MADILIRGVNIPKPNEGAYLMQVFHDGRTIVYHYAVSGKGFGTDSRKVIETKAVPLPEGHGRLIDADKLKTGLFVFDEITRDYYINRKEIENATPIVPAEGGER